MPLNSQIIIASLMAAGFAALMILIPMVAR
jgi:hypothetical protein